MGKKRIFSREFKVEAVRRVVDGGQTIRGTARELGIRTKLLDHWKKQYLEDPEHAFPGRGHRREPQDELSRLRREVEELRRENEFLKKTMVVQRL